MQLGNVTLLGDPHLGRKFIRNVPLNRRGEREAMQWKDFYDSLNTDVRDYHVCVGDIFDKIVVSNATIYRTIALYIDAARNNPDTHYIIIRGNHDASRDDGKKSAYDLLAAGLRAMPNITVLEDEPIVFADSAGDFCCIPWHPYTSALEMVQKHWVKMVQSKFVIGHWDVIQIGDDYNRIPAAELKKHGVEFAVSGHDHNAREVVVEGLPVIITGSMQPYSHAEDKTGELYVTVTPEQVEADPDSFKNKCVRVRGQLNQPLDCLQLSFIRPDAVDEEVETVQFESFDMAKLFGHVFEKHEVPEELHQPIKDRYDVERAAT